VVERVRDLVLVGGGHAHVQVLRRWMMRPLPGVRLTLVTDRPEAVYSGMVPGFVAGDYAAHELEIDCVPLARRAGARVVLAAATRIDPLAHCVELEGRAPLRYEIASLDVGSSVRGLELPGVREHALATRPIRGFVDALEARLSQARSRADGRTVRIAIAGGGAAGVELAFTLRARLVHAGVACELALYTNDAQLVPGYPARVARRVSRLAAQLGIEVHLGVSVDAVDKQGPVIDGTQAEADLVVWATGAAAPRLIVDSPLPHDADGFVRVTPTLQVEGHEDLFAVGDCAALPWAPWVRKAGVYAVREGPALDANLRASMTSGGLRPYRPQRDFLSLLNLGGGRALGAKWGLATTGRGVWRIKDWIDRRFMRRFRVLESEGADTASFPSPESMGMEEMPCGGCAAKVAADPLERALARLDPASDDPTVVLGLARADDAAAVRTPSGDVVLTSVDAFRAFTDDPWLVGRVAAVNAASDIWAKGGRARHALAHVNVPEEDPALAEETLFQVLSGVRAALDPVGISLVGGHTTQGEALLVGLTVSGDLERESVPLALDGARPGDVLLLTKPLGTGVLLAADMQGRAAGRWLSRCIESMVRPNRAAAALAREHAVHASTDVSGFGLAGHLVELLRASGVAARLQLDALPALDGALALLERGVRSTYHAQNAQMRRALRVSSASSEDPRLELLFDPQTSGGLLLAVAPESVAALEAALREAGDAAVSAIGEVIAAPDDGALICVEPAPCS
jgi:selenide,water dikinase